MKKALVLLLTIALIGILAPVLAAETMVQKPNLPADYTNWSDSFNDSCKLDDKNVYAISSYGRIDPATNTLEFVRVITANGNSIYTWHTKGYPNSEWTSHGYFPVPNSTPPQWLELDNKREREIR